MWGITSTDSETSNTSLAAAVITILVLLFLTERTLWGRGMNY